ncbi:SDR family NAD(P)-dependent oxidoreductase [Phytomonospora sp. NPDC050363]|uniref:SDR family NAD(P)-dependent oxidoreductase n=1 Tax=Phytomonospora sp. NPDC050363 TaxID=3155642 RepID=UPI0033FC5AE6
MKTIVITGGTDGIGRALARTFLRRRDRVIVVGRDAAKAPAGAEFIAADLALVAENRRVLAEITATAPAVDALVLCARHYRSARAETAEGFEENFALFHLSRHVLGHGLASRLEQAPAPVIMSVAGPGAPLGVIAWGDLQLTRGYNGGRAMTQAGKLADLLGVDYAAAHPGTRVRYVLHHPGVTVTGHSGTYSAADAAHVAAMRRGGKTVGEAVVPILHRLDDPPAEPLSAYLHHERIPVDGTDWDTAAAARLRTLTEDLLAGH